VRVIDAKPDPAGCLLAYEEASSAEPDAENSDLVGEAPRPDERLESWPRDRQSQRPSASAYLSRRSVPKA
jgi:hypothetical protein